MRDVFFFSLKGRKGGDGGFVVVIPRCEFGWQEGKKRRKRSWERFTILTRPDPRRQLHSLLWPAHKKKKLKMKKKLVN